MSIDLDKTFITADQHFGHMRILQLVSERNIFSDVRHMDKELITRWNSVVGKDDMVIHAGDFALSSRKHIEEIMTQLNGNKILVLGNHDMCRSKGFWLACGFIEVVKIYMIPEHNIVITHSPDTVVPDGMIHLYGHKHSSGDKNCISVELTNYTPVKLSTMV